MPLRMLVTWLSLAGAGLPTHADQGGTLFTTISSAGEALSEIHRSQLDGTNDHVVVPVSTGYLGIDVVAKKLYFGNVGTLDRCSLAGTGCETVLGDVAWPQAITVDPYGGKLYFRDGQVPLEEIVRANLDGTDRETIVTADVIPGLDVDPVAHKIYWSQQTIVIVSPDFSYAESAVRRANLDGSSPETVLTLVQNSYAPGVVVDPEGTLYIGGSGQIFRADLDGTDVEPILTGSAEFPLSLRALALDRGKDELYFAAWVDAQSGVWRIGADGSGLVNVFLSPNAGSGYRDVELDVPGNTTVVPAASNWGLVSLALVLALAATVVLVRRTALPSR
jgi:hypothetical protein